MNDENEKHISLNILRHIEILSNKVNGIMAEKSKPIFGKYPLTFATIILIGVVAVSEGLKDIITSISFYDGHPWRLLFTGLLILIITGTIYKKLEK